MYLKRPLYKPWMDLTSSYNNVHGVVNDNSNHYGSMIMDEMRMNKGDIGEYSFVDEEPKTVVNQIFILLKDHDKTL